MNNKHKRILEIIWADPINGDLAWARVESLFVSLGCKLIEASGSSVTFEYQGCRATFHWPHPGKEALRYRIKAAREFLERIGVKP